MTPDTPREEPLPCPFCGPTAMTAPFTSKRVAGWLTECGSCGAHQNLGKPTAAEAIAAWNRRAPAVPEKPQEAVAWVPDEMDAHQVASRLHKDGIHFAEETVGRVLLCVADYLGPSVVAHPVSPALVGDIAELSKMLTAALDERDAALLNALRWMYFQSAATIYTDEDGDVGVSLSFGPPEDIECLTEAERATFREGNPRDAEMPALCARLIDDARDDPQYVPAPVPEAPRLAEVEAAREAIRLAVREHDREIERMQHEDAESHVMPLVDALLALLGPAGGAANEGLRPEVLAFAWQMELKLRKHDAKRGRSWQGESVEWLMNRAADEWAELQAAKRTMLGDAWPIGRPEFVSEAADVANFLWMAAFNAGALTEVLPRAALSGAVPAHGAGETK